MNNRVMVIPGTEAQVSLICKLKEMGYEVVCIHPDENSEAFTYADYIEVGDILDKDFCLNIAEKYQVIAVLSDECDIAMPTVGYVSDNLGLPSIGMGLASLYTNKYLMREFCQKNKLPCPKYAMCRTVEEAEKFAESLAGVKMILKPLDSNSSRGVFTIKDKDDIRNYFGESMCYSKVEHAVLCEEYIEGTEFTVDGIVINGKHISLAISRKKHYDYNKNIACELYFSQCDKQFDYNQLRMQNDHYVELTGLPMGFTHAEYKYNGKEFILIEIGARGGGNFISSHIVPRLTGIDTYRLLIESILLNKQQDIDLEQDEKCAVLKFFDVDGFGGTVSKIEGEDFLRNTFGIVMYEFRFKVGETIDKAKNDNTRVGFYIAVADDREKLDFLIDQVSKKVKIILEKKDE